MFKQSLMKIFFLQFNEKKPFKKYIQQNGQDK